MTSFDLIVGHSIVGVQFTLGNMSYAHHFSHLHHAVKDSLRGIKYRRKYTSHCNFCQGYAILSRLVKSGSNERY